MTVTPSNAPTISCPGNISQNADAGQCSANVTFAATANDDCNGSLPVTYTINGSPITSPHSFPKGTTTVTATATDSDNQTATCSFTVTVTDTQAPAIDCASVAAQSASTDSNCSATVPDVTALVRDQASDNCTAQADLVITQSPAANSTVSGTGSHPITVTVKDADNNSTTCVVGFTINDTTKPTINCPANITRGTDPNQCAAVVSFAPSSGSQFPRGTTTVTCMATDAASNKTSCSFTVKVFDYVIVDDSNGKLLRFVSTTGEYDFFDCRKNKSLSGQGTVTINSCKTELRDAKPDRTVTVLANPCTRAGTATVVNAGTTQTLNDANLSNNRVNCP